MQGKYRKITIKMKRESTAYQLWKQALDSPVCYVESYKEKRAVFFHGENLLPGKTYHLILIGDGDGQTEHQDFGPLHTGTNGELQCYRSFGGVELEAYQFCLLCVDRGDGQMDIVYKGSLFVEGEKTWEALCKMGQQTKAFTAEQDETDATWYRLEDLNVLPPVGTRCLPWIKVYGHYIIGKNRQQYYIGVPGRFLKKEQPLREEGIFLLWQPIRGGEAFFDQPDQMSAKQQEKIFGYWIAGVDIVTGNLQPL